MALPDDELLPREAHAIVGQEREREGFLGVAYVQHYPGAGAGDVLQHDALDRERQCPVIDHPGLAFGTGDRHHLPVAQEVCAVFGAHHGWHAEFATDNGGMAGASSRLVMMAAAFFMIGSQSGSVLSVTSTSPSWKVCR